MALPELQWNHASVLRYDDPGEEPWCSGSGILEVEGMTREQSAALRPYLELLATIEPEAVRELTNLLENYLEREQIDVILRDIKKVGKLFPFNSKHRKPMARLCVLAAHLSEPPALGMSIMNAEHMRALLKDLKQKPLEYLRDRVLGFLLQRDLIREANMGFTQRMGDPSRRSWDPDELTLPGNYLRYRYLITALRPIRMPIQDPHELQYLRRETSYQRDYVTRGHDGIWSFYVTGYYFGDPEALSREILSCSLISETRNHTYMNMYFGFILHVPEGNIVNAEPRDLVAADVQHRARAQKSTQLSGYKKGKAEGTMIEGLAGKSRDRIMSPGELLRQTPEHGHNEVIVVGTYMGQVRPTAIFVKVTRAGTLWSGFVRDEREYGLSEMIFRCSETFNLPIIPIYTDEDPGSDVYFQPWLRRGRVRIQRPLHEHEQAIVIREVRPSQMLVRLEQQRREARIELATIFRVDLNTPNDLLYKLYKKMAVTHHPDKTKDDEKIERFRKVQALLDMLLRSPPESSNPGSLEGGDQLTLDWNPNL